MFTIKEMQIKRVGTLLKITKLEKQKNIKPNFGREIISKLARYFGKEV